MQQMRSPGQSDEFGPFWPFLLMAVSFILVLTWNTVIAVQQWRVGDRMSIQQEMRFGETMQAEDKLKAMMVDLIDLSKRDQDAKSIIKKYNVTFNSPTAQSPAPAPQPAAKDDKDNKDKK